MNYLQLYGLLVVIGGACATLSGFGVILRPQNISDSVFNSYKRIGPIGVVLGIIQKIGSRSW